MPADKSLLFIGFSVRKVIKITLKLISLNTIIITTKVYEHNMTNRRESETNEIGEYFWFVIEAPFFLLSFSKCSSCIGCDHFLALSQKSVLCQGVTTVFEKTDLGKHPF